MTKLTTFLLSSVFLVGANIDIVSKDYDRQMPSKKNEILSYNEVLKDVRRSVVNISTQKSVTSRGQRNPFMNDPFFREFFGGGFNQVPR